MLFDPREKRVLLLAHAGAYDFSRLELPALEAALAGAGLTIVEGTQLSGVRSFILSESSLFVAPGCLLAVTCGTAKPAELLDGMLELVPASSLSVIQVEQRLWPSEFMLESEDCPVPTLLPSAREPSLVSCTSTISGVVSLTTFLGAKSASDWGSTRVLLRKDLPPARLSADITQIRRLLRSMFPRGAFHEHIFSPAGYSANATNGISFACVHITPGHNAYISIEMTSPEKSSLHEHFAQFLLSYKHDESWLISERGGDIVQQERRVRHHNQLSSRVV